MISGISMAVKALKPSVKVIGVESSGAPGMRDSVRAGQVVTLDRVDCIIDGLRVKRVGQQTFEVVRQFVDDIVTLPDEKIFEAMLWIMSHLKLVVEGAAAAPVAVPRPRPSRSSRRRRAQSPPSRKSPPRPPPRPKRNTPVVGGVGVGAAVVAAVTAPRAERRPKS